MRLRRLGLSPDIALTSKGALCQVVSRAPRLPLSQSVPPRLEPNPCTNRFTTLQRQAAGSLGRSAFVKEVFVNPLDHIGLLVLHADVVADHQAAQG